MKQSYLELLSAVISQGFVLILFQLHNHFDWGQGFSRGIVLLILFSLVYFTFRKYPIYNINGTYRRLLLVIAGVLLIFQVVFFIQNLNSRPIDIGTTSLTAIDVFWNHGINPYSYSMDESATNIMGSSKYFISGYKYLPVTFFLYSPLGWMFGTKGIYITNFVLYLLVLFLLYKISQELQKDKSITLITLILYLSSYTVTFELFKQGVNDIIPLFFILSSYFFLLRNKEIISGILIGLSLTSKWLPAPIFLILLIFAVKNKKKFLLSALGISLAIMLPFVYWDFKGLIGSIAYPTFRAADSTSFLFGVNTYVIVLIKGLFFLGILWLFRSAYGEINSKNKGKIHFFYSLTLILVLLSLGQNHRNYWIWLIPFLCLCLANFSVWKVRLKTRENLEV